MQWAEKELLKIIMGRRWSCCRHWPIICLLVLLPLKREGTSTGPTARYWSDHWNLTIGMCTLAITVKEKGEASAVGCTGCKDWDLFSRAIQSRHTSKMVGCDIQQYTRLQPQDVDFSPLLWGWRMKPEEKARHYYHLTRKGWGEILLWFISTDSFPPHWPCEWLYRGKLNNFCKIISFFSELHTFFLKSRVCCRP